MLKIPKTSDTKKGMLLLISGPSGSGKGTICQRLLNNCSHLKMELSVSATTRPPRPGEVDGRDYFFMYPEEFEDTISKGGFLEWAPIYGYKYGTPAAGVMHSLEQGKNVILEIDVQGGISVKKSFPEAVLIFILPPTRQLLKRRLIDRNTDSLDEIEKRMNWVDTELAYIPEYDFVVINDGLEDAVNDVKSIIKAEQLRTNRFKLPNDWK